MLEIAEEARGGTGSSTSGTSGTSRAGQSPARELTLLQRATAPIGDSSSVPRSLLLFAHPDDETLALGARLARFRHAYLVHATDGAPCAGGDARTHSLTVESYREARFTELQAALDLAGVGQVRRECLGIPDQQAALGLEDLTRRVLALFRRERVEVVFTHPYEGGHPDHDAVAFAAHEAIRLLTARGEAAPLLIEPAFYHAGPSGIETGCFLPTASGAASRGTEGSYEVVCKLSTEEQQQKRDLLSCFRTQAETLGYFGVTQERFRLAPSYDFTRPPHQGSTFYDRFSWGMTSARFPELAKAALRELGLPEVPRGAACH